MNINNENIHFLIHSMWLNVGMAQYGEYQLEESKDQRVCVRSSKRENKVCKHCIRKEQTMAWAILRGKSPVKEVIYGRV